MPKGSTKSSSRIKRARNRWLIYRSETLKVLSPAECYHTQQEWSKLISAKWRNESKEVKDFYAKLAEHEKALHKLMYPDYVYRPRRRNQGKSSSEEKLAIGKRKSTTVQQPPISEIAVEPQALEPTTTPSNSEPANLPRLAVCEELQHADFTCSPNGMDQAQASTSHNFRYVPDNFPQNIDSHGFMSGISAQSSAMKYAGSDNEPSTVFGTCTNLFQGVGEPIDWSCGGDAVFNNGGCNVQGAALDYLLQPVHVHERSTVFGTRTGLFQGVGEPFDWNCDGDAMFNNGGWNVQGAHVYDQAFSQSNPPPSTLSFNSGDVVPPGYTLELLPWEIDAMLDPAIQGEYSYGLNDWAI